MSGSFINQVISGSGQPTPEVGMPATVCMWSDRDAATVVEVLLFKSGPRKGQVRGVVIQEDTATVVRGSGHDGSAEYEYTRNPDAPRQTFLFNSKGRLQSKSGDRLSLGARDTYRDPSF